MLKKLNSFFIVIYLQNFYHWKFMYQKNEYTEKNQTIFLILSVLNNLIIPTQSILFDPAIYTLIDSLLKISSSESLKKIISQLQYICLSLFPSQCIDILLKTLPDDSFHLFQKQNLTNRILLINKYNENLLQVIHDDKTSYQFYLHKILFQFLDIFRSTLVH